MRYGKSIALQAALMLASMPARPAQQEKEAARVWVDETADHCQPPKANKPSRRAGENRAQHRARMFAAAQGEAGEGE